MSKTPVLTKKQQKSSLSAKKTKTKEILRNALASPYSKYWPLISNGQFQALKNVLNQCLPKLLPDKVKIPWTEIRKVPKSERKKFREQYIFEHLVPDNPGDVEDRAGIILGINAVTKALENQEAKSILISEDILPRLMVEHIIDQAVLLEMPVLIIPELRNILKEKCGISSCAVGFTDCPRYKLVQDSIQDISKKYPIPDNHIHFNRAKKLANDSVILIEDSIIDNSKMDTTNSSIIVVKPHETENKCYKPHKKENTKHNMEPVESIEPVKNVHLIRETKNKRVFIPESTSGESKRDRMEVDSSGFLSFSADTPSSQKSEKKYLSLKVLRIKGDSSRTKRKIQALKEKKIKPKGNKKIRKDRT